MSRFQLELSAFQQYRQCVHLSDTPDVNVTATLYIENSIINCTSLKDTMNIKFW